MYEATSRQREYLRGIGYSNEGIDRLEKESDDVRGGIPINMDRAMAVVQFQEHLREARQKTKRFWEFWI